MLKVYQILQSKRHLTAILNITGRRFPSIRVKDKKAKKKETKDVSKEEYSNTVGSCAQPVSAIYGTLDNDKLSNIYENGHIILRQQQQQNSKWKRICSESKPVLAVIFVSLVVFITAGAILLYQSRKSLFFDDSQVDFQTQE